jgi:hypothetical protein
MAAFVETTPMSSGLRGERSGISRLLLNEE